MPRRERRWIVRGALAAGLGLLAAGAALGACSGWDPSKPFERNAPEVDEALGDLDSGQLEPAEVILEKYLGTGACSDAGIGLPDGVRLKSNGSFDLGLVLFYLAEHYGQRFGDEESGQGAPGAPPAGQDQAGERSLEIDCALVIVKAIAADPRQPAELRARAYYLAGNLEFLRRRYEDAVRLYDEALKLVPGIHEEAGGDGIGRDAAWNRAIALRRIQDKDAGQDGADGDDANDSGDADQDSPPDAPDGADGSEGQDAGDKGDQDAGKDGGGSDGGGKDGSPDPTNQKDQGDGGPDAGRPEPKPEDEPQPSQQPDQKEDDRMLDRLEEAPTYQEQEAKNRGNARRGRVMEDK